MQKSVKVWCCLLKNNRGPPKSCHMSEGVQMYYINKIKEVIESQKCESTFIAAITNFLYVPLIASKTFFMLVHTIKYEKIKLKHSKSWNDKILVCVKQMCMSFLGIKIVLK